MYWSLSNGISSYGHPTDLMLFVFQEEKGGPYTASIPLKQATDPDADVLLAYEMNGEVWKRNLSFHN